VPFRFKVRAERAAEEDVVLEVDVLHQLGLELVEAQVERPPRRARLARRNEVGRQRAGLLQGQGDVLVLPLEGLDLRRGLAPAPGEEHREEPLLLLLQVVEELQGERLDVGRESAGDALLLGVDALDFPRHLDEERELRPEARVVPADDPLDDRGDRLVGHGLEVAGGAGLGGDLVEERVGVEAPLGAGLGDGATSVTAVVESVATEDAGGGRVGDGEVGEGRFGLKRKVHRWPPYPASHAPCRTTRRVESMTYGYVL
jgi:hypothetical protein